MKKLKKKERKLTESFCILPIIFVFVIRSPGMFVPFPWHEILSTKAQREANKNSECYNQSCRTPKKVAVHHPSSSPRGSAAHRGSARRHRTSRCSKQSCSSEGTWRAMRRSREIYPPLGLILQTPTFPVAHDDSALASRLHHPGFRGRKPIFAS